MQSKRLGLLVMLIGIVLIAMPLKIPGLTTVIVDSTAPQILSTFPAHTGWYSKVVGLSARVDDGPDGSGVSQVTATINAGSAIQLQQSTFDPASWSVTLASPITAAGNYIMNIRAVDIAGNANNVNVNFAVGPVTLAGKWFINDIEIGPNTDKFITPSKSLSFKFVKDPSVLVSSSQITVSINCDSTKTASCLTFFSSQTLSSADGQTWTTTKQFPDGRFSIILKADAGSSGVVAYNIMTDTGSSFMPTPSTQQIIGTIIALIGFIIYRRGTQY